MIKNNATQEALKDNVLDSPQWADHAVFSVEEAAKLLRMNRWSAYQSIARGDIPAIRIGRRTLRISRKTMRTLLGE
jgi:excisionase family DNA binding protein